MKHLAFTPDGSVLATGGEDGSVKFWELATGRLLAALPPYPQPIRGLAFAPDGKHVAVVCLDPFVRICDRKTAQEVGRLAGHSLDVTAVVFSPDGTMLASGGRDGSVRVWDWQTRKTMAECSDPECWDDKLGVRAHKGSVQGLAFSPDGKLLASSGGGAIKLWQPTTDRLRATLADHERIVWGLAFAPDGRTLASGGEDGTVRLWDADAGRLRMILGGHAGPVRSLAFSPDGRTLASASGEVKLWQAATGRELAAFTDRGIRSVAWAPRRLLLAGGGSGGAITLWDAGATVP